MVSTESAINSLLGKLYFIPGWFIAMPSQMPMVLNSKGTPPSLRTPAFGDTAQMDMSGHDLVKAVDHTNKRFRKVIAAEAHGSKQGPMRCPFNAFLHFIATHCLQKTPPWLK
jgi:hypothetical protein